MATKPTTPKVFSTGVSKTGIVNPNKYTSTGGGSSSGGSVESNPLVFDTPAYLQTFGQKTPNLSVGQKKALESSISSYAASNPDFKALADVFSQQLDAQKQIADMQKQPTIPFEPTPQPNVPAYNAFVGSVGTVQDLVNQQSQDQLAMEQQVAKIQNERTKLAQKFDLGSEYQDLQKQYEVPQITKQLQEANLQLSQMQSQYQLENQNLAQQAVPQPFIIGQQNELQKTAAIKIGAQASYVQALQGNLDLANHYVDKIIDLEAKDYERKYNVLTDNLNLAMNFLDRADKKQAQAIQFQLDLKKADYSNMLESKSSVMKTALAQGAPNSVIQEIASASSLTELYSSAGRYAVEPKAASVPTIKTINNVDYQWNPNTGQWETPSISGVANANTNQAKYDEATTNLDRVNSILSDKTTIGLITGQAQGKIAAFFGAINPFQTPSSQASKVSGLVTGQTLNARDSALSDLKYIVNNQTFDKLTQLKQGGATFGALSDPERVAIGRAASYIAASVKTDPNTQEIIGFNGSPEKFEANLKLVQKGYQAAQDQYNSELGLTAEERLQISNIK